MERGRRMSEGRRRGAEDGRTRKTTTKKGERFGEGVRGCCQP